jgi:hypothetical protein
MIAGRVGEFRNSDVRRLIRERQAVCRIAKPDEQNLPIFYIDTPYGTHILTASFSNFFGRSFGHFVSYILYNKLRAYEKYASAVYSQNSWIQRDLPQWRYTRGISQWLVMPVSAIPCIMMLQSVQTTWYKGGSVSHGEKGRTAVDLDLGGYEYRSSVTFVTSWHLNCGIVTHE